MATLTVQTTDRDGAEAALAAAASGGDEFANTGQELLLVNNGSGAPITVTIVTQQSVDGLAVADKTVAVAAGELWVVGPFPTPIYNDGDNLVQLTYSTETDLTVGVLLPGS